MATIRFNKDVKDFIKNATTTQLEKLHAAIDVELRERQLAGYQIVDDNNGVEL